ncbi:MAG: M15 family metallopeptidase [Hyphomicrobiaceae bacterium]
MHRPNQMAAMVVALIAGMAAAPGAIAGEKSKQPNETAPPAADLPRGFVDVKRIAPHIIIEMRYATKRNFTGRRVTGYRANRCILARPVAKALARVQRRVRAQGFTLKVYDCYRPVRAVAAFMRWAEGKWGRGDTRFYYPRIARSRVIPLGYISKRSSHSRGTAIDLTLVRSAQGTGKSPAKVAGVGRTTASCIDSPTEPAPVSLDMGTSWDCFDVRSHTYNAGISATAKANRQRLLRAMRAQGFRNYKREWWHFSMPLRGYMRMRNFPVE